MLRIEEDIIARIEVRSKILIIVYNKCLPGLYRWRSSDEEVGEYILNNLDVAYTSAIQKDKDGYYILNIAAVENFAAFHWHKPFTSLLNRQLEIFTPLIQKFIADAATRTLDI